MNGLIVTRIVRVKVSFTAEQWQLYTASMPCGSAATTLNIELNQYVNNGFTRAEVRTRMHVEMSRLRKTGAFDTEPRAFLETVLDEIFGPEPVR